MFFWPFAIGFYIICQGVISAEIRARTGQECILLRKSIYCYGGAMNHPAGATTPERVLTENVFIRLNVSRSSDLTELQDMWDVLDSPETEFNYNFAMAALPTLDSFIIDGGRGSITKVNGTVSGGHMPQQIVSLYNASGDGSWTSVNSTRRNHTDSHAALTGKNNTVYIYGGRRTGHRDDEHEYPQQMITFNNQSNPQWHYQSDFLKPYSSQIRIHHKGSFGLDQQTIYYIGGAYRKTSEVLPQMWEVVDMSDILTYDTRNGTWGRVRAHGIIPTPRVEHTVTLNPITGDLIIYGGASQGSRDPLEDFMYTFNTQTLEFKSVTPVDSTDAPGAGPRFGHSAVLVDNNSLFILFGSAYYLDTTMHMIQSEFYVLDISNGYAWKPYVSSDASPDTSDEVAPWKIALGISFGMATAAVVAGVCFCCLMKRCRAKSTQRKNEASDDAAPPLLPRQSIDTAADSNDIGTLEERKSAQEEPLIVRLTRPDTPKKF